MRSSVLHGLRRSTLCAALLTAGCASEEGMLPKVTGGPPPTPWTTRAVRVESAVERGTLLDVELATEGDPIRLFLPNEAACRALASPGAELDYGSRGALGYVDSGTAECSVRGTAAFWTLLDHRPPIRIRKPRDTARYGSTYADADILIARGRFPLFAQVLGVPGDDVQAVLPADPPCAALVAMEEAAMEYDRRTRTFSLLRGEQRCEILGLVQGP